jgi:AcrR family transcriptional regulator
MPRKRESIIEAGEKLLVRFGVRRVTVEEISREAGVTVQAFASRFRDIEDLARVVANGWVTESVQRFEALEHSASPLTQKLELMFALGEELVARPGPVFVEDVIRLGIDITRINTRIISFLEHAQNRGEVRSDIAAQVLFAALSAMQGLKHNPELREHYREAGILAKDMYNLFYEGVLRSH